MLWIFYVKFDIIDVATVHSCINTMTTLTCTLESDYILWTFNKLPKRIDNFDNTTTFYDPLTETNLYVNTDYNGVTLLSNISFIASSKNDDSIVECNGMSAGKIYKIINQFSGK